MLVLFTALATALAATPNGSNERRSPLEAEIAARLEVEIGERLALGPDVRITVQRLDSGEALRSGRLVALELSSKGRPLGWVTAKATIAHKKKERELWLRAEVVATGPTLVATRALERGATLAEGDVRLVLRPLEEDRLEDFEPALGAILRWPIAAGELVSKRALDKPDVVARGAQVQVVISHPGFVLKAPAEAMNAGALGAEVNVRLGNHKVMRGVVTGPGEIEVRQ